MRDVLVGSIVSILCVIFIRIHVPIVAVIPAFMVGYGPIPSRMVGPSGPASAAPPRSATEADPAALRRPDPPDREESDEDEDDPRPVSSRPHRDRCGTLT